MDPTLQELPAPAARPGLPGLGFVRGHSWVPVLVVVALLAAAPYIGVPGQWVYFLEISAIFALISSGLGLSFGYAGEFALGQVVMFAAGAYLAGYLNLHHVTDLFVGLVAGALAGALIGLVTGIPGLRLGHWPLAMASFFLVFAIPDLVQIAPGSTGGAIGLDALSQPTIASLSLGNDGMYVAAFVVLALWLFFIRNLMASRNGVAVRMLKVSPLLARSLGVPDYRLRILVYVVSAIPAGCAGALFADAYQFVSPSAFGFDVAIGIFAAVILGGSETIYGPMIGAAVLQGIPFVISGFSQAALIVYGAILLAGGLIFRTGLLGAVEQLIGRRMGSWSGGAVYWEAVRPGRTARPALAGGPPGESPGTDSAGAAGADVVRVGVESTDIDSANVVSPDQWAFACDGEPLTVTDVHKQYGGVRALQGVSLVARPGQVTALVGANGSGKTTLLNIICGFARPDSGSVSVGSTDLGGMKVYQRAQYLGRTFQTPLIPSSLSTLEVVASGRYSVERTTMLGAVLRTPRFRHARHRDVIAAEAVLEMVGLSDLASRPAASVSFGTRRLVELARVLVRRPAAILLDEPAAGLDEDERQRFVQVLHAIKAAGPTILLVEHNMDVVAAADTAYLLDVGRIVSSGTLAEIRASTAGAHGYFEAIAERAHVDNG